MYSTILYLLLNLQYVTLEIQLPLFIVQYMNTLMALLEFVINY